MPEQTHRAIKSFVLRQGRFTKRQRRAIETLWPQFGLENPVEETDFAAIFNNNHPLFLEIGFGTGDYLLSAAGTRPQHNFIGIEVHRPGVGNLLAEIGERQLQNIRVFSADAIEVLEHSIPDHSLDGIYLFFPDPWHKRRHHKRRIVQPGFAALVHRKLKSGGLIHMATDWAQYAEHMMDVFSNMPTFSNISGEGQYHGRPADRPLTRFETRGHRLGHTVYDLIFKAETVS